ncbi:MAG: hypothetical protein AAB912_03380 [Patescibacteria group bacterium]
MRAFFMAMMAIMAGCLSWSRQQYEAQGGTNPPKVQHSSWSVGVLPARSPVEAASADAIGTDARTRSRYGGVYGIAGYADTGGRYVSYRTPRSVEVSPARSSTSVALAGAIAMDTRVSRRNTEPAKAATLDMSLTKPNGVEDARVIRVENNTLLFARVEVDGEVARGGLNPAESRFIVSPKSYVRQIVVCGFTPEGKYRGTVWQVYTRREKTTTYTIHSRFRKKVRSWAAHSR